MMPDNRRHPLQRSTVSHPIVHLQLIGSFSSLHVICQPGIIFYWKLCNLATELTLCFQKRSERRLKEVVGCKYQPFKVVGF